MTSDEDSNALEGDPRVKLVWRVPYNSPSGPLPKGIGWRIPIGGDEDYHRWVRVIGNRPPTQLVELIYQAPGEPAPEGPGWQIQSEAEVYFEKEAYDPTQEPAWEKIDEDNVPRFPPPRPGFERRADLPGEEPGDLPEQVARSRRVSGSAAAGRTEPPAETTSAGRTEPSAKRSSAGGQQPRTLVIATVALGAAIVFSTIVALILLVTQSSDSVWTPILQDMVKTAFGALAVGALGGLAKLLLDQRKAKEAEDDELHDQQRRYIDTLVGVSHDVDNARSLISANRSVRTWTDVITGTIVPAKTRLRDIEHELTNWGESGVIVFSNRDKLDEELEVLGTYLSELIREHADNKQSLAEKQNEAEKENGQARLQQLANIWDCLNELEQLGDFIRAEEGYECFRQNYLNALTLMRSALRLVQE